MCVTFAMRVCTYEAFEKQINISLVLLVANQTSKYNGSNGTPLLLPLIRGLYLGARALQEMRRRHH
jgi:hypothetical protein